MSAGGQLPPPKFNRLRQPPFDSCCHALVTRFHLAARAHFSAPAKFTAILLRAVWSCKVALASGTIRGDRRSPDLIREPEHQAACPGRIFAENDIFHDRSAYVPAPGRRR